MEAGDLIEEHNDQRIVVEVQRHIPETHQLVNDPVQLVAEATVAPEPDLVAERFSIEVLLVRVLTELARVSLAGSRERNLEELGLILRLQ